MFKNYAQVLKKYAVFSGCANKREFWTFLLSNFIIGMGLGVVFGVAHASHATVLTELVEIVLTGWVLAILVPSIALTVRRLHDTGVSGWWFLISYVPYIGTFAISYLCARPSRPQTHTAAGCTIDGEPAPAGGPLRVL